MAKKKRKRKKKNKINNMKICKKELRECYLKLEEMNELGMGEKADNIGIKLEKLKKRYEKY